MVVDPRRTPSAQWADLWLGLDVGTDIPLANAVAREILEAGLADMEFVERATTGFEEFRESIEPWTLEEAERVTGVPADAIRELAHAYGRAQNAQLCWTLGITEHHNAVDNVFALINLALLTGKVGKWGSGLQPLRGQNNVQGGGDMGAIPNRLPGFQDLLDDAVRAKFEPAGARRSRRARAPSDRDVRGDGARRAEGRLRRRREPGAGRGRPAAGPAPARGARPSRRPGPLPHAHGAARRRRPPGGGDAGRGRGHRHLERAPRAARAQGVRRAGRRPRRHRDRLRARSAPRLRARLARGRGRLERAALALADACRDELRPARGARRHPVAVRGRGRPGRALHPRPALGRRRRGPRTVPAGRARPAGGRARRRLPAAPHDRPPARVLQHRRPDQRLRVAAPRRRRGDPARARGRRALRRRRRRPGADRLAARLGRGARRGTTRTCDRASRS